MRWLRTASALATVCVLAVLAAPPSRRVAADQPRGTAFPIIIEGTAVGITDGDTITVLDAYNEQHKIRLDGIDAPETKQAYGTRAKQALSAKVYNQRVRVEWRERDKYQRIVGRVYVDSRPINREMVEDGWAWHFKKYSRDEILADAERSARASQKGLWADPHPIPPWEFRHPSPAVGEQPTAVPPSPDPQRFPSASETVFVTRTGESYHVAGCPALAKSQIPIALDDAKKRYRPCSVCNPPR